VDGKFLKTIKRLGNKYKFLKNNPVWIIARHLYCSYTLYKISRFYAKNTERIAAVANMLADEKSKDTYLGIIKFRQTYKEKDYPFSCYEESQYFIEELKLNENEVFIDCGAYTGDTIDVFLSQTDGKYAQIIAFEPCLENFAKLQEKHGSNSKITLINAGVYDKDGDVCFDVGHLQPHHGGGFGGAKIVDDSNIGIQVKKIDNLNLTNVSFIKMDIEGAELNALKGARQTILRDKPKLAISIYHSEDDMIRIAEYVRNLESEYKLYVRHHGKYLSEMARTARCETVLYALPY